ncbi:hypothetical protein [Nonomuraea typhae]|uniref:HEAT repeat domain-containing protein n=1 Tax=Nonomuraea typhae TaxID=2603600 RepID=A0ABW7Z8M8_9ACTN
MTLWTEIRDLVAGNQVTHLADRLVTLTEQERAELGGRLPGLVKELRRARTEEVRAQYPDDFEEMDSWEVGDLLDTLAGALLLAGVGVVTGPAAAVAWMTGRDVNRRWADDPDVAQVCRVAATRPLEWRRDVAVRLARRVRRPADRIAPLAVALLRESGAVPPDHDPLVAAWLTAPGVADDPLTPLLLPRVFTADGAGRALRDERLTPRPTRWLAAARELPKEQALDGCVSRFLRGGEAQDLRFFVRLHTLLDPTPAESAARLRDYLRLLPSAPGTVAELAAGQLRGAMPLDHADLVEAVDALAFRDEAKLAATGLRWLGQAIRATPTAAGDFVTTLTTSYTHKSFDVRSRAVELTLKHADLFAGHAGAILDGARHLPADLGEKLAERFGGDAPAEEPPEQKEFPPLPETPQARRFPEPSISPCYHERWIGQERWLAAFVAGIAGDRAKLRRKLKPLVEHDQGDWRSGEARLDPDDWQSALSAELVSPGSVPEPPPIAPEKFWDRGKHSVEIRTLSRGEEPYTEPPHRRITVGAARRPGRYLDDDAPPRVFSITWTSGDGPDGAVAREGDRQIPFSQGRIHLYGSAEDHLGPVRTRPGVLYDDSVAAMPHFILDRAYEHMAGFGVDPVRIAAMRAQERVPPPGPNEPLVQVTVDFVPPRLRSFMPEELPEQDEWRRRNRLPRPDRVSPPHDFLLHRYAELAAALRNGALPTWRRRCCGCPEAATGPRPAGPPRSARRPRARPPAGSAVTAWPTPSAATCGAIWSCPVTAGRAGPGCSRCCG